MNKYLLSLFFVAGIFGSSAFADDKLPVNICTGGEGKPYYQTGQMISQFLQQSKNVTVNVVSTNGTWDNIQRIQTSATPENIASGQSCQVFVGQPDGAVVLKRKNPAVVQNLKIIGQGPVEYLHVLCSKESGVEDIADLAGQNKYSVALGSEGSGAWLIWQNFVNENKAYADVQVTPDDGAIALAAVSTNQTTCMLVPSAIGNSTVTQADTDFGDGLVLVGAYNDRHFNNAVNIDGKPLYNWASIPGKTYPNSLQSGWFGTKKPTIAWQALIYADSNYFRSNQKALADIISAIAKTKPSLKAQFGTLD